MPMNSEVKALWLAALRSGEYEQGRGRLRGQDNRFCCLGVLCDIHAKAGLGEWIPLDGGWVSYGEPKNRGVLTTGVMAWAGLGLESPKLGDRTLAEINDTGMSFADIADIIEENL